MSLEKVVAQIKRNKRFLITAHINLEGDALGSQLALRALLQDLGKRAEIIVSDKVPREYNFLPGIKTIRGIKEIKDFCFGVLIVLDCSDLSRCKEVIRAFPSEGLVINIDHHISNTKFGDINWIDAKASSACEMVYQLYQRLGIAFDKKKALWLYTGLLTDTGSFRYPNTTSVTHAIARELMRYDIGSDKIYKNIYENLKYTDLQLLNKIFLTIKQDATGKIIWFEIKRSVLKKNKINFDLTDQVLNFGRLLQKAEVIVLFKEVLSRGKEVRVNLRSNGKIDVNKIANLFGGGGHKNASGCTLQGSIRQVRGSVLDKVREALR